MASLADCPDELLLSVISCLSQADLGTICLVNRHLRALAEPYLYADVRLTWKRSPPHPITLLLRSILRRPQLAAHIRAVSLLGASVFEGPVPKLRISESEMRESMIFVADTRVPYREDWLDGLWDGTTDAYVAVLLSQPLRLTSLVIGHDYFKESRLVGSVLRSTLTDLSGDYGLRLDFENLKRVSLERYTDPTQDLRTRNTADVLPLFYLPSIQYISASMDNPDGPFTWPAPNPPSSSSLRSLKLTSTREPFLDPLLSVTDQLQTFYWRWFYDPNLNDRAYTNTIELTQFTTALSHVRNILTELIVVAECELSDIEYPLLHLGGSLTGIKDFNKLTKLTVPVTLLVGFSATDTAAEQLEASLPPNLVFLNLTDDLSFIEQYLWEGYQLYNVLQQWLGRYQVSTPCLQGITLSLRDTIDDWDQPMRDELRGLCERVGIRLEVIELVPCMYQLG
jgi:hypothetical protein